MEGIKVMVKKFLIELHLRGVVQFRRPAEAVIGRKALPVVIFLLFMESDAFTDTLHFCIYL